MAGWGYLQLVAGFNHTKGTKMNKAILIFAFLFSTGAVRAANLGWVELKSYECQVVAGDATGLRIEYQGSNIVTTSYYGTRHYYHNGAYFDPSENQTVIGFTDQGPSGRDGFDPANNVWLIKVGGTPGDSKTYGKFYQKSAAGTLLEQGTVECSITVK